ncbi:hypothetical protein TUMEXPCC7403_21280 [Tumidithrix helvetica PCC 7403]|uniref:energy transducer TonB n=1 Tax=Tumidithrix helvetica TaxID=3457545 RepID=UPI003CB5163F
MKLPFKFPSFKTSKGVTPTSESPVSEHSIHGNPSTEHSGTATLKVSRFSVLEVGGRAGGAIASLISKNLFWFLILVSAGIHTAFLLLAPNPIKKEEKPRETEVISTIPVVKLPVKTPLSTSSKPDLKFPFNFNPPTSRTSTPSPFTIDPFANLNTPSQDPFSYPFSSPLSVTPLNPEDALPVETRTEPRETRKPVTRVVPDENNTPIDNTQKPVKPPQKANNLKPEFKGNDVLGGGTPVNPATTNTGQTTTGSKNEGVLGDLTVFTVIQKIGGSNIMFTEIAPSSANISAVKVEKGVMWIPPKTTDVNGKQGTVEVALLVAPNGKVEESFFKSSGVAELDKIARETVNGYYDKFQPIKEEQHKGKYRYVTIKYSFPSSR